MEGGIRKKKTVHIIHTRTAALLRSETASPDNRRWRARSDYRSGCCRNNIPSRRGRPKHQLKVCFPGEKKGARDGGNGAERRGEKGDGRGGGRVVEGLASPAATSNQSGSRSEAEAAAEEGRPPAPGRRGRRREESTGVSPGSNKPRGGREVTLKLLHGYRPLFPYCSRGLKGTWPFYFSLRLCLRLPSFLLLSFLLVLAGLRADLDNFGPSYDFHVKTPRGKLSRGKCSRLSN